MNNFICPARGRHAVGLVRYLFGPASGRAPCRWLAVHHGLSVGGNDHIHLMVNLVREDGSLASTWNERRAMSRLCAEMEATTTTPVPHLEGAAAGLLSAL